MARKPKIVDQLDGEPIEEDPYQPSENAQKIIGYTFTKWMAAREVRMRSYRHFNDRSLVDYVNDSSDRFNGYIVPRQDLASDWGAHVFNNITRNKVISIIAQITNERVKSEFFARLDTEDEVEENEERVAKLFKHLDDYAADKNNDEELQLYTVLEAVVKGTAVGYEGYKKDTRKVKEITDYNPETGEISYEEKTIEDWDDVYSEVLPLFDIYPANIYQRDIQKQPYIIWRTILDYSAFQSEFEKYPNFKYVKPQAGTMITNDDKFKAEQNYITPGLLQNQVEVIRYFCKQEDEFHIIANGVLLTPEISPFPWDHKMYPFWVARFEPLASDFFYGKSLPDKLKSDQDVLNTFYQMVLDQAFLSINPPLLTSGSETLRDETLYPGRRISVDDIQGTRELQISAPNAAHMRILETIQNNMNQTSIDNPMNSMGGSRITAYQIGIAKEFAQKLLSLFLRALEWSVRDKTNLRIQNIMQFYRLPKKIEAIGGEEDAQTFRELVLHDVLLADGTKGKQIIKLVGDQSEIPSQGAVDDQELHQLLQGKNVAYAYVSTDLLRHVNILVKIIPNSSVQTSEALEKATELDFQQKIALLYPDLLNRQEAFKELVEVFGKDPTKLLVTSPQGGMQVPGATPPGGVQPNAAPQGLPPTPSAPNSLNQAGAQPLTAARNAVQNVPR